MIFFFAILRVFCAAGSQLRGLDITSFLALLLPTTAVWRTQRPHTPHQERPSILRAILVGGAVAVRKLKCNCSVAGEVVAFCVPRISTTAAPQKRVSERRNENKTKNAQGRCSWRVLPGFGICEIKFAQGI